MSRKKDQHSPPDDALWFLPLGGSGEIGMNMNLYGVSGKWLMVDCGVTFGDETTPGIEVIMPDITFIEERRNDLVALVVTHGHEDHLGAIEYLWSKLQCPIYATPFTAELIRSKLAESNVHGKVRIIELPINGKFSLGPFAVEFVNVTHSIPESNMLAITTKHGTVLHTGDWKLDPAPQVGKASNINRLMELGKQGVLAVVGDSTNATVPGHSGSEKTVRETFINLFGQIKKRIIVTCFSSNIARVQSAAVAAAKNKRELVLVGRSLWRNTEIADTCGYLPEFRNFLSDRDGALLPRNKAVYVCTGSQGEVRAALTRLAAGEHQELELEAGDTVIYSSKEIPGNEKPIARVQNALLDIGVQIITENEMPGVHVSGHPAQDELTQLYEWVQPKIVIPVHGELRHQTAHVELIKRCGIKQSLIPTNGQIISIKGGKAFVAGEVQHGRLGMDGKALRPLNNNVMKDRKRILFNGAAMVSMVMNKGGKVVGRPKVSLLGIVGAEADMDLLDDVVTAIEVAIENMPKSTRIDDKAVAHTVMQAVRRIMKDEQGKKPLTEVHITRV
ncbi:MAG: RNase J family beta-CASP ribonuclease [Alphaproteobacteria bacterium]|nr:RNase J family beta-CASP ribonuclease [Alphaproteobacteria bacterium]